jgi:hypothetical protein
MSRIGSERGGGGKCESGRVLVLSVLMGASVYSEPIGREIGPE